MRDGRSLQERLGRRPHSRGDRTSHSHPRQRHSHTRESRHRSRSPVHHRLGRRQSTVHQTQSRSHTREPRPPPIDCRICGEVVQSLSAHVLRYHSEESAQDHLSRPHARGHPQQRRSSRRSSHTRGAKSCHICQRLCPNLARHFQRQHQLKKVGFVCPFCRHGCSKYDVGMFRKHLKSHSSEELDVKGCLVSIPEGYYRPLICPNAPCHYRTLTALEMDAHVAQHIQDDTILAINMKLGVEDNLDL